MQIAVIDDDRAVRDSLALLLEIAGHEVSAYASAEEFLQCEQISLVKGLILDQHMAGITGLDLARRLRASECLFPILLVTAAPSPDIIARAAEFGIANVLSKPFAEGDIMAFVQGLAD